MQLARALAIVRVHLQIQMSSSNELVDPTAGMSSPTPPLV